MPGKLSSLKTNIINKALDNFRGIGLIFNQVQSTFEDGIAKLLYKVLKVPMIYTLNYNVFNFILRLSTISYWKYRRWI